MLAYIKNAVLMVILAALIFALYGGMLSGSLPMQTNNEPAEMCAVFSDEMSYSMVHHQSIKKYARETGLEYKTVECK